MCINFFFSQNFHYCFQVILLCLHHLPPKSIFNIITFGTTYDGLFVNSKANNTHHRSQAEKFIQSMKANMGNTEAYRPLHAYFLLNSKQTTKNVFLVSDGHINNEEETLKAVGDNYQNTRVFTLGVRYVPSV